MYSSRFLDPREESFGWVTEVIARGEPLDISDSTEVPVSEETLKDLGPFVPHPGVLKAPGRLWQQSGWDVRVWRQFLSVFWPSVHGWGSTVTWAGPGPRPALVQPLWPSCWVSRGQGALGSPAGARYARVVLSRRISTSWRLILM